MICIEVGGACSGAPCSFGCFAGGPLGYTCGCPSGYQRIGQGHCLSSISPASTSYDNTLNGYPIHPIHDPGTYNIPDDKIISTEGCYSCKLNGQGGRHKRSTNTNRGKSDLSDFFNWAFKNSSESGDMHKRPLRHHKHHRKAHSGVPLHRMNDLLNRVNGSISSISSNSQSVPEQLDTDGIIKIVISLAQTKHRRRIIKLQPALNYLQNNIVYNITKGNEDHLFKMSTRNGVSSLHFTHRIKHPGLFILEIVGRPLRLIGENLEIVNDSLTKPPIEAFHIRLRIHVIS